MRGRRLKLATVGVVAVAALLGAASASAATDVQYATVPSLGSVILVIGEPDSDQISVSLSGNTVTITDQGPGGIGTTSLPTCTPVDPNTVTCPFDAGAGAIRFLSVFLGEGDDTYVDQNLGVRSDIIPAGGTDNVQAGAGDDFVDDSVGADIVNGGAGDDFLDGTSGNTDTGPDVLDGGPGSDFVDYGGLTVGVTVTLGDQLANDGLTGEGDNLLRVETVQGSDFADSLRGSAGSNELRGQGGDDQLAGLGGNDELFGDDGDDTLSGGASKDGARDRLACGLGTDIALTQPEDRTLPDCERRGARLAGDNASVDDGAARVRVKCPGVEGGRCAVTLRLFLNGHRVSERRKLKVKAGNTRAVPLALTKLGKRTLRRRGGRLIVSGLVSTREPGGTAANAAQVLLFR
jgi:hypothetical protein